MAAPDPALPALDPDVARLLARIHAPGARGYDRMAVPEAREFYNQGRAAATGVPLPLPEVRDLGLPTPARRVRARLYRPEAPTGAGLVYFHGGGWVLGDLDSHDTLCRRLAAASGATVISVDYALAPEAPFPAPLDEAVAVFDGLDAAAHGIDPTRLAIGGDSAGGNLAAAACLTLRASGGRRAAAQLLIYPALDLSMSSPSQRQFAEGHLLTRAMQAWCHGHYLSAGGDVADWRVSPLRAAEVAGLPPAIVLTASHDPLRDEGEAYAHRLAAAGVPVTLWRVPGQVHAFLPMDGAIGAAAGVARWLGLQLRAALADGGGV